MKIFNDEDVALAKIIIETYESVISSRNEAIEFIEKQNEKDEDRKETLKEQINEYEYENGRGDAESQEKREMEK